jgi:hypothetical protein
MRRAGPGPERKCRVESSCPGLTTCRFGPRCQMTLSVVDSFEVDGEGRVHPELHGGWLDLRSCRQNAA